MSRKCYEGHTAVWTRVLLDKLPSGLSLSLALYALGPSKGYTSRKLLELWNWGQTTQRHTYHNGYQEEVRHQPCSWRERLKENVDDRAEKREIKK